ncbi:hypothetical protein AYR66_07465 [Noviherbaspirillum denitrificans]|uniref:Chitin-binding type-3 domain-containing protein n=2 Tax=Noviherbaspirillum denitrificans TaxID=1968433 RepID=A0A254T9N6_9BURK|nr:hypothetical protein AYR66_00980 [Noviherbaspirillum denitrificans]OWW19370.1 hypothetical protein AYR66_07465 [Noviherbaspirillum denitrificans]
MLTSSTVVETAPAAYNAATTYALDATASVAGSAGLLTIYKSLQGGNTGNTPASSPSWWTVIGTTYQTYSGGATYALGDRVIDATAHLVYESLAAGNTGNALTNTTKWLEIGPTNKWAMFDVLRNTATSVPGSLTVVITPGRRVDSIALLGVVANSATITVTNGGSTVYTITKDLNKREVLDWYDYFFRAFATQPSLALFDLPPYTGAVITVTLTATSGNVQCGACVLGSYEYIGDVQYSAESDVLNFSTVTRNFDGSSELVPRRNVPKTVQQIWLEKSRVNRVRDLRDALNATPAVWAGLDDSSDDYFEALLILGIYKRFSINLRHPQHAVISLELEEI